MEQKKPQYGHAEAFCLMWYRCEKCRHVERIWNSRDGVTPFSMTCTRCEACGLRGGMKHSNWSLDYCKPDHQLEPGQYFWRDGTPEEAAQIMRDRIEQSRDHFPCDPEREEELVQSCLDGTSMEFPQGWPMLDQAPKEEPKTETVLVISGTAPGSVIEHLERIARKPGVCLKISTEELPVGRLSEVRKMQEMQEVMDRCEQQERLEAGKIHLRNSSGKHRHKKKGRNRRKW